MLYPLGEAIKSAKFIQRITKSHQITLIRIEYFDNRIKSDNLQNSPLNIFNFTLSFSFYISSSSSHVFFAEIYAKMDPINFYNFKLEMKKFNERTEGSN